MIGDPGTPDAVVADAAQHAIQDLPDDVLVYLLGSRYCETDRLTQLAWSLFSNTPVRSDIAMTGEITLRGLVLPIGGLKEKSLAAMRAGISTVIIPKLNEKDLVDVPEEAKQKLKFIPVENVDEVLNVALEKNAAPSQSKSS